VNALDKAFADATRPLLVGYLPAGYPSYDVAADAMVAMVEAGFDVVEIGLPYSDPIMDGPVIEAAVHAALQRGIRTTDVLRTVATVAATGAPTLIMSSWNPLEQYGIPRLAKDLVAAGGVGLITPDVLPEEAGEWISAAAEHDLSPVFLVAPSSTTERIRSTAEATRGFLYAASTMGVTGARSAVSSAAPALVARVREQTDLPVGVGLGVSTGEQAAEIGQYADAVIVGSALVRALNDGGVEGVRALAADLAAGVRSVTRG
jgi:tryptophan synthase alpha chain